MKTATTMIVMKVEIVIIGTKIVNQVLITIRLNPLVKIKQNAISDTAFNVQSPFRHLSEIFQKTMAPQKNAQKSPAAYVCHALDIYDYCSRNCSICT